MHDCIKNKLFIVTYIIFPYHCCKSSLTITLINTILGYPESMSFDHFRQRFELLTFDHDSATITSNNESKDASMIVLDILRKLEVPETSFKIGLSMVSFMLIFIII